MKWCHFRPDYIVCLNDSDSDKLKIIVCFDAVCRFIFIII